MPLHLRTAEHAAVLRPACCGQLSSDASPRRGDYRRDSPADCLFSRTATRAHLQGSSGVPPRRCACRSAPARRPDSAQDDEPDHARRGIARGREKYKVPYPKAEERAPPARGAKLMGRVSQRRNPRRARTSRVQAARRHVIPRAGARPRAGAAQNHKRMTCQKKSAQPARRRGSGQDDESDHARRVAARAGGRLATD